jgi:hypothetical protein
VRSLLQLSGESEGFVPPSANDFVLPPIFENISWFIWYKIKKEKMNKSNLILCGIENSK